MLVERCPVIDGVSNEKNRNVRLKLFDDISIPADRIDNIFATDGDFQDIPVRIRCPIKKMNKTNGGVRQTRV
jgi:hypothetical protein